MGLVGGPEMADIEQQLYGDLGDDDELEAELLALQCEDTQHGGLTKGAGEKPVGKGGATSGGGLSVPQSGMKKIPSGLLELDQMIQQSMQDVDEEVSDTEDPELEAELLGLAGDEAEESYEPPAKTSVPNQPTPPSTAQASGGQGQVTLIQDRLTMYEQANSNAVTTGDRSKARRLDRGIKTLKEQLKKAKSGKVVAEDDIPPAVVISTNKPNTDSGTAPATGPTPQVIPPETGQQTTPAKPTTVAAMSTSQSQITPPKAAAQSHPSVGQSTATPYTPPESLSSAEQQKHRMLHLRQEQFRSAAMEAKHRGDLANAQRYLKTFKQFDAVLKALEQGQPIDLSQMPPPPPGFKAPDVPVAMDTHQGSAAAPDPEPERPIPETDPEEKKKIYQAPEAPGSLMEALEQRVAKYKEGEASAKQEGSSSKARRMGRIVKQYEEAIKITKIGKPYAYEDLPTPPGFPPLPIPNSQSKPSPPPQSLGTNASEIAAEQQSSIRGGGVAAQQKTPPGKGTTSPTKPKAIQRQPSTMSRAEQQTIFLQERQLQFRKAALKAKQKGEMELARKYLKLAKGFDQMIEASQAGLPVDMSQVPADPGAKIGNLEFVSTVEDGEQVGDRDEMYKKLEQELIQQIRTCTSNAEHFSKLGDVSSASKFDKMCLSCRKDLDALKNAYKHGDPVPRFHYENRSFSIVKSCSHLGDNDLELVLIRGINYNLPSGFQPTDLDTYAKYEFPFPKDEPQKGDSSTVKHTNCPEYDQTFKINVERKSRVFMRVLNSKSMKVEIYYKRGFFKGDKLLGCANIKLQPLENVCVLHESYDLMDGRKAVGGKLEVKLQVRNPFINKQVEEVKEKWLVVDKFERALHSTNTAQRMTSNTGSSQKPDAPLSSAQDYTSMEVLRYEKQQLEQQIRRYQDKLKESELTSLRHKGSLLDKRVAEIKEQLKKEGVPGVQAYADAIEKTGSQYMQEARALVAQGNREKAQIVVTKKKIIEKEVEAIRSKYPR